MADDGTSLPPTNTINDPKSTLQTFDLTDLARYTAESSYSATASRDFHLFFVGRDDVHDILKHVLSRASVSLHLNMFGYDDDELNEILMAKAKDPSILMTITLDKSQAGGQHEAALLKADQDSPGGLIAFNTHFVTGQSATRQISHTKGFVADGKVGGEGSTNWSGSGEGIFVVTGKAGGAGFKAQNNTQTIFTDPDSINRFQTELISEHLIAKNQQEHIVPDKANRQSAPKQDASIPAVHPPRG